MNCKECYKELHMADVLQMIRPGRLSIRCGSCRAV